MRKRPPRKLKVAVPDGEGMKIVSFFRKAKARQAAEPEELGVDWLVRKYKKDGKVNPLPFMGVFAGLKGLYADKRDTDGNVTLTIPFDLFDVIGSMALDRLRLEREQIKSRRNKAAEKKERFQARAVEIWHNRPSLSESRVGKIIAEEIATKRAAQGGKKKPRGESARSIRGKIRKP